MSSSSNAYRHPAKKTGGQGSGLNLRDHIVDGMAQRLVHHHRGGGIHVQAEVSAFLEIHFQVRGTPVPQVSATHRRQGQGGVEDWNAPQCNHMPRKPTPRDREWGGEQYLRSVCARGVCGLVILLGEDDADNGAASCESNTHERQHLSCTAQCRTHKKTKREYWGGDSYLNTPPLQSAVKRSQLPR